MTLASCLARIATVLAATLALAAPAAANTEMPPDFYWYMSNASGSQPTYEGGKATGMATNRSLWVGACTVTSSGGVVGRSYNENVNPTVPPGGGYCPSWELKSRCLGGFAQNSTTGPLEYCYAADSVHNNMKNTGGCTGAGGGGGYCLQGNPINPATGNKVQHEVDYRGEGPFPLRIERWYESNLWNAGTTQTGLSTTWGIRWRGYYDRSIAFFGASPNRAFAVHWDGKVYGFVLTGGVWVSDSDVVNKLERLGDGSWRYITWESDEVEVYSSDGKLLSITNRAGLTHTVAYNGAGNISTVTDSFGRTLTYTYDANYRVTRIVDPAGGEFNYTYQPLTSGNYNNLLTVQYPDTRTRTYQYSNTTFRNALTGIVDENGVTYASFTYDDNGRVATTQNAGGANLLTVTDNGGFTQRRIRDAFNEQRYFNFTVSKGVSRLTSIGTPVCPTCGPKAQTWDANGFLASRTDWNDNRTNFTHDARGLETSRTEGLTSAGASTAVTRTIDTTWDATFRLPLTVTEKNAAGTALRTTTMTYDGSPETCSPGR